MSTSTLLDHLRTRPRLVGSVLAGIAVGLASTHFAGLVTRALVGWNTGTWLFLILTGWMMFRADHEHLRRAALAQAESAGAVLALVTVAVVMSLVAIVYELSEAKHGGHHAWPHVTFAFATVIGSWLLLPTLFAMNYATLYHRKADDSRPPPLASSGARPDSPQGLMFPDPVPHFKPGYADFLYFSFTIAVACQTSDVMVSSRAMRRLVLLHSLLSFAFNTTVLAFTINLAASLF